jgi:hypothetical protein
VPRIIRGVEFANRNQDARYPLIPSATCRDTADLFSIPNDLLVGLQITVPADLRISPASYRISRVIYTYGTVTLFISGLLEDISTELGRFDIARTNVSQQIQRYGYGFSSLMGLGDYSDLRGRLLIGSPEGLNDQPQGEFWFDYQAAGISVDCIRPMVRHINVLEVQTASGELFRLAGVVRLRGGDNMAIRIETVDQRPVVVLDALDSEGLTDRLQCDQGNRPPIRTINGLSGDAQRAVELTGSNCLEIEPGLNGIRLQNNCSEPCASCQEAEALQELVEPFVTQVPTLTSLINRLQTAIDQLSLSSKLSQGNPTCGQSGG